MKVREVRFSDHYRLGKSQAELDFVDVPIKGDVLLFIDPYAFTLENDPWFIECNDHIVDFFTTLIDSIRAGDLEKGFKLLSNLHEPYDTHLGFSLVGSAGRGIGKNQAEYLLDALKNSRAVQTGALDDLSDCELLVFGISADKISDITTNIIRGRLLEYTEAQCALHSVPVMNVQGGIHWDISRQSWVNRYANLPVINGKRLLLIPKVCVRFRPEISANDYYDHFVLDYLEAEHLRANDSLVETLKNGAKRVRKSDLRAKYRFSKEYLFEFSQQHPDVLKAYKAHVRARSQPLRDRDVEVHRKESREIDYSALVTTLDKIPAGPEHASAFHNFVFGALQSLFYPELRFPRKEQEINDGRKRIDISFNNGARQGFFEELRSNYQVHCPFILVECKNYSSDPANPELDQLIGRFSDQRGKFGLIVCREVKDPALMLERCKDVMRNRQGAIFVLDDKDMRSLLDFRAEDKDAEINKFLNERMRQLVM